MNSQADLTSTIGSITVPPERSARVAKVAFALIAVGVVLCVLALTNPSARQRFGAAYLLGFTFLWTVVLGSLFFVALQHLTRSIWSVVLRRVAEMFADGMWIVAAAFVPILILAWFTDTVRIFPWLDPHHPSAEHMTAAKKIYLDLPFFTARAIFFLLLWIGFSRYFVRKSLSQDSGGPTEQAAAGLRKVSAPFILIFALTGSFAAFDWLMCLDPTWYSTIFGVYVFSGMVVASLSAITLAVIYLRWRGHLGDGLVSNENLYGLGGLIFAFSCFWAYIAFSQFMLIWYGNLPEETTYFIRRLDADWLGVTLLLTAIRFVVPFFLLLSRSAKINPRRLVLVSILMLIGEFVDLYWLIMPELNPGPPALGWPELGPPILMIGMLLWSISRFMQKHRMVALGDPLLERSRNFHL